VRDGGIPKQNDVIVVEDLAVTAVVGAEWQRQQLVGLEVAVDVDTVGLPHADGEVGGAEINFASRTISFSSYGKRSLDGCGALLPRCGA